MSHYVDEEDTLTAENVGWKRSGTINIAKHKRGWPNYPEEKLTVRKHTRSYPDVWTDKAEWKKWAVGAEPNQLRTFVKNGKVCIVMLCKAANGAKLMLATSTPLPPGVDPTAATMGWSPWGSIKKAAKKLGKTTSKAARGLYKVAKSPQFQKLAMAAVAPGAYLSYKALKNPQIRQFAMQMAPMAGAAFGVPPHITAMATGVLQGAMQGQPGAMGKVRNIAQQAAQGYGPATQLRNTMSMLYRGGMQQWGRGMQLPRQPAIPQMPQFRPPRMPWQQPGMPQLPYGMHRFRIPTPGWGRGYVSGWLYNIPVRTAAQAALDSPMGKLRDRYKRGMVGWKRSGTINIAKHKRGWPNYPEEELTVRKHTRSYPDVWTSKKEWQDYG